jgi:pimeloyl-ACP methyl ester carboxylesterase
MTATEIQEKLKRKFPPSGKFEYVQEVWLHYWEYLPENYNEATHDTVVMIHGLSGSLNDFLYSHTLMNELKKRYRIILIDRPGAGYSYITNEKTYTLENQIEVIKELLNRLNVVNPIIVGHSLGGALVLNFAALHSEYEARYVLLAPLIYTVWLMYFPLFFLLKIKLLRMFVFRIILWLQNVFFHQLIKNAFRPNAELMQEDYEAITKDQLSSWLQLKAEFTNLMTVKDSILKNEHMYKNIKKPLRILVGKNDKIIPAEKQAKQLIQQNKNVTLELFSRTGHMINFARPHEVVMEIDNISAQTKKYLTN